MGIEDSEGESPFATHNTLKCCLDGYIIILSKEYMINMYIFKLYDWYRVTTLPVGVCVCNSSQLSSESDD